MFIIFGDSSANLDLAQIKMEEGSVATPFEPRPIAQELALCQRYYFKTYNQSVAPGSGNQPAGYIRHRMAVSNSSLSPTISFPVTMRTNPTITVYSPENGTSGALYSITDSNDKAVDYTEHGSAGISRIVMTSARGSGDALILHFTADAEL